MTDESTLPPPRHEPTDIPERLIWIGAPALAVTVVALALLILWLFPGRTVDRTIHLPLPRYPTPELQITPRDDMTKFYREEMRRLNSSGWVDKEHGIAHIPIDDAMQEVATEGIAGWPTQQRATQSDIPAQPVNASQPRAQPTP